MKLLRFEEPLARLLALACLTATAGAVVAARDVAPAVVRIPRIVAIPTIVATPVACTTPKPDPIATWRAPTRTVALHVPFRVTPELGGLHVFPIAERTAVVDTFGAIRSDVAWHHGDDLFAPRDTPVVAVANGTLFSVGRQRLGGLRLWLVDEKGNEFYYAHLQGYAPHARDGASVRAGDVIGYVGNSGDAEATPPHLHFEIHPASLLALGYDGAVDPTDYLDAWPSVHPRSMPAPALVARAGCASRVVASVGSR